MEKPKILVSSVDAWSDYVGSDTLSSLLSQFDSSNIASINIRARKSDSKVAGRYFHILEERIIKSIFSPSVLTGEEYTAEKIDDSSSEDAELSRETRRYSKRRFVNQWLLIMIREIVWKLGRWRTRQLNDFVKSFSPDVFFFPIEGYIHLNRINKYIIDHYHPSRVVGYMWDDNFTFKQRNYNPFYLLHRLWLRRSVKQLISRCNSVFAITPKMKRELDAEYGINSILLTKPMKNQTVTVCSEDHSPIRILYTGKLIADRDKTLAEIADAIRDINKGGKKVVLDIYTDTVLSPKMKARLDHPGDCNLMGFIPQAEIIKKQSEADILLFVETLSQKKLSARLSFSTKITDYFSAGKCIWAVGNKELAPIGYLSEEDAAIVSYSMVSIREQLNRIVKEPDVIIEYAQKAYECGQTYHNSEMITTRFKNVIEGNAE